MRRAEQETMQEQIIRFMEKDEEETFISFGFGYGFHTTKNDIEWFEEWEPEFLTGSFICDSVISFKKEQEYHAWLEDYATLFNSVFHAMDYCTVFEDASLDFIYVIYC